MKNGREYAAGVDKKIADQQTVVAASHHAVGNLNRMLEANFISDSRRAELQQRLVEAEAALEAHEDRLTYLHSFYDGWERYFLVANPGGHIHSSTYCSSCFSTTQFMWLTEYSAMDAAELVELAGERACTVCFPDAPVDRPSQLRYDVEQRAAAEARRSERDAKRAEKLAKAILPDGSKLRLSASYGGGSVSDDAATIASAKIVAVRNMAYGLETYPGHDDSHTEHLKSLRAAYMSLGLQFAAAVATRTGQDLDELIAELTKKAEKKARA